MLDARRRNIVFVTITLDMLLAALDQTIVGTALPVFDRMVDEGYLSRDGSLLSPTQAGAREARVISESWAGWLTERVEQDIGRPSGAALRAAGDTIAKRLLVEDLSTALPVRTKEPATATAR